MPSPTPTRSTPVEIASMLGGLLLDGVIILFAAVLVLLVILVGLGVIVLPMLVLGPVAMVVYGATALTGGVYKHVLTRRYLRSRIAPLFASSAVTLFTAMVIVIISIMGGFLTTMREATHRLESDIVVDTDASGFAHYEEMIAKLKARPEIEAATPVVQTFGLLKMAGRVYKLEVLGVRPSELNQVLSSGDESFEDHLYWSNAAAKKRLDWSKLSPDERRFYEAAGRLGVHDFNIPDWLRQSPLTVGESASTQPANSPKGYTGIVIGIEVSHFNRRDPQGQYHDPQVGEPATVQVLPLTEEGGVLEPTARHAIVINEFKSGLYEIDANRMYLPLEVLQQMLHMDEAQAFKDGEPVPGQMIPARATMLLIKAKKGAALDAAKRAVEEVLKPYRAERAMRVRTWEEVNKRFLDAVANEKNLLTFLFAFVSIVAVVMIAVIFYMIVLEKTRDIGILRAMGGSRSGIAAIFLGYGLAIGVLGAGLGTLGGCAMVWYLNEVQGFLGTKFGMTMFLVVCGVVMLLVGSLAGGASVIFRGRGSWRLLGGAAAGGAAIGVVAGVVALSLNPALRPWLDQFNFVIWKADVYYFDKIPNQINPVEISVIAAVAVLSSVVGAIIPAVLAANKNPVESLRYE